MRKISQALYQRKVRTGSLCYIPFAAGKDVILNSEFLKVILPKPVTRSVKLRLYCDTVYKMDYDNFDEFKHKICIGHDSLWKWIKIEGQECHLRCYTHDSFIEDSLEYASWLLHNEILCFEIRDKSELQSIILNIYSARDYGFLIGEIALESSLVGIIDVFHVEIRDWKDRLYTKLQITCKKNI